MLTKFTYLLSILVFGLIVFSASETLGQNTGLRRASIFKLPLVENEAADLDQCANGAVGGTPVQCTGAAWQNGNLNQNQAHYYEGESIAYRMRFSGLVAGSTNTVTIEWDTTENAKHALDYVTSFNQSETDAIPCSGVVGCVPADRTEFAIPLDPLVSAGHDGVPGTTDDITQIPGVFTLFGGTISGVSTYTTTGTFAGSSQTRITITFHADVVNPVLAWSGHISTRVDWGVNNSAIAISGSPYHMRLIDLNGSGGNQDRSLSSNAAVFPGSITIVKLVASAPFYSGQAFDFTTDPILGSGFSLTDANSSEFAGGSITFPDIVTFDSDLVFTEAAVTGWTLSDLTCSIAAGGGTAGTFATDLSLRRATVTLKEGNSATCTFSNLSLRPTAAAVSISGRVVTSMGTGISMARITIINASDGSRTMTLSNPFGYYSAGGLRAGEFYLITAASKQYTFADATKAMTLYDDVTDVNFVANP